MRRCRRSPSWRTFVEPFISHSCGGACGVLFLFVEGLVELVIFHSCGGVDVLFLVVEGFLYERGCCFIVVTQSCGEAEV